MTEEDKKVLYGAARINRIKKTENDAIDECLVLLQERGDVPFVLTAADGQEYEMMMPVGYVVSKRLEAAVETVEKLRAGAPA